MLVIEHVNGGNVLTTDILAELMRLHEAIVAVPGYQKACQKQYEDGSPQDQCVTWSVLGAWDFDQSILAGDPGEDECAAQGRVRERYGDLTCVVHRFIGPERGGVACASRRHSG